MRARGPDPRVAFDSDEGADYIESSSAGAESCRERNEPAEQPDSLSNFLCPAIARGVVREGAIAAGLTALMILLFLGSWRSTLIIAVSIPLAVLTSLVALA